MELVFILSIVNLFLFFHLKGRIDRLEKSNTTLPDAINTPSLSALVTPDGFANTEPEIPVAPQAVPQPVFTEAPSPFITWLKEDFLMKVGGLFLLMALGWFVSYAFANNWIGPMGRVALGLVFGAGLLVFGAIRIRTFEHQGAVFTVLGSTTILLTVAAGHAVYGFFTPLSALGLVFLSVLFVTFVSLQYRRQSLALAGLILASIAPHFIAGFATSITEQFMYLFAIVLGTLWIVYITGWRTLTFAALIIVFLKTFPYLVPQAESTLVLLWVFMFVAIFFIANIISILRVQGEALSEAHLFTAFGTAFFLVLWVFTVAPKDMQSLLFVFWMLVFSFGAYIAYKATSNRIPFYVYGATSLALLASATAAELDGPLLVIAFTFETAIIVFCAEFLRLKENAVSSLCLLFIVPFILSLKSIISPAWKQGVLHGDFFVLTIFAFSLLIVGLFMYEQSAALGRKGGETAKALMLGASFYGLMLIWLVLHAVLFADMATMLALIVYTIIGVTLYKIGSDQGSDEIRTIGGILIGFVAGRLLLVEVWQMGLAGRIITFLAIGVLLISTAFMKKKKAIESSITNN